MTATLTRSLVKCYTAQQLFEYSKYEEITGPGSHYTSGMLHNFGGLYRLIKNPHFYNESHFAISTAIGHPICLISLTRNESNDRSKARPCELYGPDIQYPNYEIMGYTKELFRGQGHAARAVDILLHNQEVPTSARMYVYSHRMERILRKLGFKNTVNLHDYTP